MLCAKCGRELNRIVCGNCGYDHKHQTVFYLREEPQYLYHHSPEDIKELFTANDIGLNENGIPMHYIMGRGGMAKPFYGNIKERANEGWTGRYQGMDIVDGELIGYFGRDTVVEVPDTVTRIGPRAFAKTDVERVILPRSLRSIGAGAFQNCSRLHIIVIPENVTEIGDWAFRDCVSLQDAMIYGRMQTIPESCFSGCINLSRLLLPDTVKTIGKDAFRDCEKLKNLMLPRNLETIEAEAFYGCSALRLVDVPDSLKSVAANAFVRTAYKTVIASEAWKQANGHLLERIRKP